MSRAARTCARFLVAVPLVLALGWPSTPEVCADPAADKLDMLRTELDDVGKLMLELGQDITELQSGVRRYEPTERFIDAHASFDLKQYDRSALFLSSLMEDERFKSDRNYYDAMHLLAISLYKQGNLLGAAHHFRNLLKRGVYVDSSLEFLIEIAATLGRRAELEELAGMVDEVPSTPALLYCQGKAYFHVGRFEKALASLRKIPTGDPHWGQAQYLLGASLVGLGRIDEAVTPFESILAVTPNDEGTRALVELTYLAMGRIAYEKGDYSRAADYYQNIPRSSQHFEAALFEMTHVHLAAGRSKTDPTERFEQFSKAEEILDILISITRDPEITRDALILRGRINMQLQKYQQAKEAYGTVVQQFSATSSELTDLAASPETIDRFFLSLLGGKEGNSSVQLFVSPDVLDWLKKEPALGRIVDLLNDLALQARMLEEARAMYDSLVEALNQRTAKELFPGFAEAWGKSREIENRLLFVDGQLLEFSGGSVEPLLSGEDRSRLNALQDERKRIELRLEDAPTTQLEYKKRSRKTYERLRQMAKELDEEIWRLDAMEEQLLAMKKILREVKYKGSTLIEVGDEEDLSKSIEDQAADIVKLRKEAVRMRAELDKEMLVADVTDPHSGREESSRAQLWRQHGQEGAFYVEQAAVQGGEARARVDAANELRRRIQEQLQALRQYQQELDRKATREIELYKGMLAELKIELEQRERELSETRERGMQYARQVGSILFVQAKEGLVRAVLEADLGVVDLAWRRHQEQRNESVRLNKEKSAALSPLRRELQELQDEGVEKTEDELR